MSGGNDIMSFHNFLENDPRINSEGTIKRYLENVSGYKKWYSETYGLEFEKLYRENLQEFKSYLRNIKSQNAKTINAKLSALLKYNEFLVAEKVQPDIVITKRDFISIQASTASPTNTTKLDVEKFRQIILIEEGSRNYCITTILAYSGLRISECLDLKLDDINLTSKEIIIRKGKGGKQRTVYMNDKIVDALRAYLKERVEDGTNYLFLSNKGGKLDRSGINKVFNKYSDTLTPHGLRHFFCTNALENGFGLHETACLAGHSNVSTTMQYANPNVQSMKDKMNLL
jgi:site-specific recombinase XerD